MPDTDTDPATPAAPGDPPHPYRCHSGPSSVRPPRPRTGVRCQGTGFRLDRAACPQYIDLIGQQRANEIMQREHPNWPLPTTPEQTR